VDVKDTFLGRSASVVDSISESMTRYCTTLRARFLESCHAMRLMQLNSFSLPLWNGSCQMDCKSWLNRLSGFELSIFIQKIRSPVATGSICFLSTTHPNIVDKGLIKLNATPASAFPLSYQFSRDRSSLSFCCPAPASVGVFILLRYVFCSPSRPPDHIFYSPSPSDSLDGLHQNFSCYLPQ
jgi:hypothetical protein